MPQGDEAVGAALDDALAAVMAARLIWKRRVAAEKAGTCLHEGAVEVEAMGGDKRLVCPDCGDVAG